MLNRGYNYTLATDLNSKLEEEQQAMRVDYRRSTADYTRDSRLPWKLFVPGKPMRSFGSYGALSRALKLRKIDDR